MSERSLQVENVWLFVLTCSFGECLQNMVENSVHHELYIDSGIYQLQLHETAVC